MYDVIVIGGGPAGSRTAYMLARQGWKAVVLEKGSGVGEKLSCTGIVGQECVRIFDIDDSVILRKVKSARLFSPSGKMLYIKREEYQASILDRAAFDIAMARRAQNAGAQYLFDSAVHDMRMTREGVEVYRRKQGGSLIARAVVIASGYGTRLTEVMRLGKTNDFVAGAQIEVPAKEADEVEVYFGREKAPGFFGWLVPTADGKARVGLLARRAPDEYLKKLLDLLASQGKIVPGEGKPSYDAIPLKALRRTYGDRVLAVGDAAGQVKPTTGGGIYYGMLCADIAADTLNRALHRDDLSAKNLSRYDREWRRKLGHELMIGYRARKLFERLSDQQIDRLFDVIEKNHIDAALLEATDVSFDWHSRAIMKLLRRAVVARVFGSIRFPFRSSNNI
ncbi:MAG: NAD(P)/FAD-dependent oxidoreductase [Dehalococcoidales bacterium]